MGTGSPEWRWGRSGRMQDCAGRHGHHHLGSRDCIALPPLTRGVLHSAAAARSQRSGATSSARCAVASSGWVVRVTGSLQAPAA